MEILNFGTTADDGTGDTLRDAAQKINRNFTKVPTVLFASGPSGPIVNTGTSAWFTAYSYTLAADTIKGGSFLDFAIDYEKFAPAAAGTVWRVSFVQGGNTVPLGINFVTASLLHALIRHSIFIADDRRTAITLSTNGLSQTTLGTGGVGAQIAQTGTDFNNTGASLGISARGNIAFATYSTAPVVETVLIDFAQAVELRFELNIANSDCCQFGGAVVTMYKATSDNYAPSMSIMCIGDSLTDGTGSSAVSGAPMDFPAQLRRTRSGAPLVKMGYGGNTAQQVVDKVIVTDANRAQRWKALIWLGTNDFVADGPAWWAAVKSQLDRALELRGNTPTIFGNFHPRASWSVGGASYVAMQYVNAQMAATYNTAEMNALGIGVADLFTALATNAGKVPAASMYDDVHLTNAGYTTVAATFNSKITALGWA